MSSELSASYCGMKAIVGCPWLGRECVKASKSNNIFEVMFCWQQCPEDDEDGISAQVSMELGNAPRPEFGVWSNSSVSVLRLLTHS